LGAGGRVVGDGRDALTLTDALLLVLPPQLVTGDAERLASLINGRF